MESLAQLSIKAHHQWWHEHGQRLPIQRRVTALHKIKLAVGDPQRYKNCASTVQTTAQPRWHAWFPDQGNEMFAGARILSSNTGETLSSALNSETATGFEIYTNNQHLNLAALPLLSATHSQLMVSARRC